MDDLAQIANTAPPVDFWTQYGPLGAGVLICLVALKLLWNWVQKAADRERERADRERELNKELNKEIRDKLAGLLERATKALERRPREG